MYHYEALGDERFQEFCQSLLVASFPNVQCLPVGQPDGGRDALVIRHMLKRQPELAEQELIVFQVKYVKSPADTRSERDLIEQVIKSEKAKIDKLRSAGLRKYYLLTNLKGTAHPETGSIDRVNALLSEGLNIEAYCWWRDDLDRRLDSNVSVKWSYPDILKATDLLGKLVEGQLGEDEERRRSAIRAYLTDQYNDDQELKFKQTELRSTMTDLFVDLPMRHSPDLVDAKRNIRPQFFHAAPASEARYGYFYRAQEAELSASYLIKEMSHSGTERIVLEGAPGQGKSTVTQYVCQIMRMQLLDMADAVNALPENHRHGQIRIPFRVDLRDLAKWLSGLDPFQSKVVPLDEREPRSLEGLLAGQVRYSSGGHSFNVSDLTAVAKASHLFLALDGFDEVADVELRKRLVDEISKAVNRLSNAGGYSVQTIVTSRPVAFAKSVRFPREHWHYFELLPLERRQVDEYTTKWMIAKRLKESEKNQLHRLLDIKLREAHTQYLAKNPMQLTILLSLIHNRGASLPEKRTAMYDAYMDMFFSRESEKSDVVRDNRDILIDIHRFLAWKLQTAAEAGSDGSIEYNDLRSTLFSYLDKEGEDTTIVDALFNGIIERVGALVSRVQDTYEFEVQPLREYFVARFLYETSPYPSGESDAQGDKFDRFNALIRNPYWLNVARFYGGCFNKGEILTLVNELVMLADGEPYSRTSHARIIALMLLGDWVFTQYQPAVKSVVSFITEYPQLRQLLASVEEPGTGLWGILPERSGRLDFLALLLKRIVETRHSDEVRALAQIINQNTTPSERFSYWEQARSSMPHLEWTKLGSSLDIYSTASKEQAEALFSLGDSEIFTRFVESQCFELLEETKYADEVLSVILHYARLTSTLFDGAGPSRLGWLATICSTSQYGLAFEYSGGLALRSLLERHRPPRGFPTKSATQEAMLSKLPDNEKAAIVAYLAFLENNSEVLSSTISPWSDLVRTLRQTWGDSPAFDRIAFLSAGIRSKVDLGSDGDLSHEDDIVGTARFARLKSGASQWWLDRLSANSNSETKVRWLLLLWLWATPRTLIKLAAFLDKYLSSLSGKDWIHLSRDFYILSHFANKTENTYVVTTTDISRLKLLSSRARCFIGQRLSPKAQRKLTSTIAEDPSAESPEIQFAMESTVRSCIARDDWDSALDKIKLLYSKGASIPLSIRRSFDFSESTARTIALQPDCYPLPLVATADSLLRSEAGAKADSLLSVATANRWFN